MAFLNRLFDPIGSLERNLKQNNKHVIKLLAEYIASVKEKEKEINTPLINIPRLQKLINLEFVEIKDEEKTEKQIIKDLKSIEARTKAKLEYTDSYDYIYKLLEQIYHILKIELHLLKKLDDKKFISYFKNQINSEKIIIKKIQDQKNYNDLVLQLIVDIQRKRKNLKRRVNRLNKIVDEFTKLLEKEFPKKAQNFEIIKQIGKEKYYIFLKSKNSKKKSKFRYLFNLFKLKKSKKKYEIMHLFNQDLDANVKLSEIRSYYQIASFKSNLEEGINALL